MSKKKTLLLAGLAAGAYAYLKKPENREKALAAFNSTKDKVNEYVNANKDKTGDEHHNDEKVVHATHYDDSITGNPEKDYKIEENEMVAEGGLTSVQYQNEEQEKK